MALWTIEDLEKLCAMWAKGILQAGHGDKRVQFDTEEALWARIVKLSRALGVPLPTAKFRRSYGSFRRSSRG